jgi:hypothetical protein
VDSCSPNHPVHPLNAPVIDLWKSGLGEDFRLLVPCPGLQGICTHITEIEILMLYCLVMCITCLSTITLGVS